MAPSSPATRLNDILDAIDRIRSVAAGVPLDQFEAEWRLQWLVTRGVEIISEASRHLPDTMKARHPDIPWRRIAGIGNFLRHEYSKVAAEILWFLAQDELTPLEAACRKELANLPRRSP